MSGRTRGGAAKIQRRQTEEEEAAEHLSTDGGREDEEELRHLRFLHRRVDQGGLEGRLELMAGSQARTREPTRGCLLLSGNFSPPQVRQQLLCLVRSFFDTLVWLQLCNSKGVALFSFVLIPKWVAHVFLLVEVCSCRRCMGFRPKLKPGCICLEPPGRDQPTSVLEPPGRDQPTSSTCVRVLCMTAAERLHNLGSGFKGKLVQLFLLGFGRHYTEPQMNWGSCHKVMQSMVRHVISKLAAAVLESVSEVAEIFIREGSYKHAEAKLHQAIDLGHMQSCARLADLFLHTREGCSQNSRKAFALAEEGARSGCYHCQGVLSHCYMIGAGCSQDNQRSIALALESAAMGSKYGQCALGYLYNEFLYDGSHHGEPTNKLLLGLPAAIVQLRLAAAQQYDVAQYRLGLMYHQGSGNARDHVEAMRLFNLAAAQGNPWAMQHVGRYYEFATKWRLNFLTADKDEAIRWYRRALAAGNHAAELDLYRTTGV